MIRLATKSNAHRIASLHAIALKSSFLASLDKKFLELLYKFLIINELVLVFSEETDVKGFVSFSSNSLGMMKRFLVSSPLSIFLLIIKALQKPENLKRFWETFRAPSKSEQVSISDNKMTLPTAELLSIAVSPACQAKGVGGQLLKALEEHLIQKGITQYKVIAGVELDSANKFYVKNGFQFVEQVNIHGEKPSNLYIRDL